MQKQVMRLSHMHFKKIKLIKLHIISIVLLMLPFMNSEAMVVFDPTVAANIMKTYDQLKQQLDQMQQQYQELKAQYSMMENQWTTAKDQLASMKGNYGYGTQGMEKKIFNKNWQWTADTWESQLKSLSGGNDARYQQLRELYQHNHDSMTNEEFSKSYSKATANALTNQVQTNQAVGASTELEFQKIQEHLTELQGLSQQIEDVKGNTDMKSATDLNSRIQTQTALINAEMVRMQVLLNNQTASQQAFTIAQAAESARFNDDST